MCASLMNTNEHKDYMVTCGKINLPSDSVFLALSYMKPVLYFQRN